MPSWDSVNEKVIEVRIGVLCRFPQKIHYPSSRSMQLKARFKMKEIRCVGIIALKNQSTVSFTGGFKQLNKNDYNKVGINIAPLNVVYL